MKRVFDYRYLLCFLIAWMITNGWAYLLLGIGLLMKCRWLISLSGTYLTILWLPFTPEKIITALLAGWMIKGIKNKKNACQRY